MKLILVFLCACSLAHADEELVLTTPRGAKVSVNVSVPEIRSGKLPALVLAPARNYHKDLPLLKGLAMQATARGFVVYRFNFAYFPSGSPSKGFTREIEDMSVVLAAAKKDARVDAGRILLGGMSLGTLVSYPIFRRDRSLRGLVLLSPVCTDVDAIGKPAVEESYPALATETRPVHFMLGNNDDFCRLPVLYDFLRTTKGNVSVDVFGGGHGLTFGKPGDPVSPRDMHNIDAAVSATAQWLDILLSKE